MITPKAQEFDLRDTFRFPADKTQSLKVQISFQKA
jgi:hypothetical protein